MSTALATDLDALTAALGRPGTDLGVLLADLTSTLSTGVSSFVGLRLSLVTSGCAITLGTLPARSGVAASMRIPLATLAPVEPGGHVVFYATRAGAFVDLAADLDHAAGALVAVLDDDLAPVPLPVGVVGLDDLSAVQRAIGYLLGAGRTPAEAEAELGRRAAVAGTSLADAARRVLTDARPT